MMEYLNSLYEGATELPPSDAIGALMLGFFLALACSGVCILLQKRASHPLPLPMLCGLIFLVAAGSMTFGIGHSRYRLTEGIRSVVKNNSNALGRPGKSRLRETLAPPPLGWQLLREADLNKNGQLTPEEAAEFVRKADKTGKGWASISEIDQAQIGNFGHSSTPRAHPEAIAIKAGSDGL